MHTGITVIVGNVGTVYHGDDENEAYETYHAYVVASKAGSGRAGNEPVTMLINGCVQFEHEPEPEEDITYELHTWFGRDRQHVELREADTERTVIEWWDDELAQAIIDGFLKPSWGYRMPAHKRILADSICKYAYDQGLLDSPYQDVKII